MASGREHEKAGKIAGATLAAFRARNEEPEHIVLEMVGGYIYGGLGGKWHDWLEPATTPNHRHVGHSISFNTGAFVAAERMVTEWERVFRTLSLQLTEEARQHDRHWLDRALRALGALLARMAAGIASGVVGGAASHLLLDGATPMGLPLLCRGF